MKSEKVKPPGRARKYDPETLIAMFRLAARLRNEMLEAGFTDNGGAIHSAERILNILGLVLNYPDIRHHNNLRHSKHAQFSTEAIKIHKRGGRVLIEHVSPLRDLTRRAIKFIKAADDHQFRRYMRRYYRLALLSPDETKRLNAINRSRVTPNRLKKANITLTVVKPSRWLMPVN